MADINDRVLAAGGWVSGHTLFSNIATTFQIVLPPDRIGAFAHAVHDAGVQLDAAGLKTIDDLPTESVGPDSESQLSLNVTFVHDEPDLRREVPAVPG
jgi:hypothetical protein